MKVWVQMIFLFNWVNFKLFQLFMNPGCIIPPNQGKKIGNRNCCIVAPNIEGVSILPSQKMHKKRGNPPIYRIFEVFRNVSFRNKHDFQVTIPCSTQVLPRI